MPLSAANSSDDQTRSLPRSMLCFANVHTSDPVDACSTMQTAKASAKCTIGKAAVSAAAVSSTRAATASALGTVVQHELTGWWHVTHCCGPQHCAGMSSTMPEIVPSVCCASVLPLDAAGANLTRVLYISSHRSTARLHGEASADTRQTVHKVCEALYAAAVHGIGLCLDSWPSLNTKGQRCDLAASGCCGGALPSGAVGANFAKMPRLAECAAKDVVADVHSCVGVHFEEQRGKSAAMHSCSAA
eukprot:21471-Heterococcus_DN1.PRE.4